MTRSPDNAADGAALAPAEDPALERHRNVIRVLDRRAARAFGLGGGATLLVGLLVLVGGWWAGGIGWGALVLFALTAALVTLWLARQLIRRHEREVRRDALAFLEANALDPRRVRDYFAGEGSYEFFVALLDESKPRRQVAAADDRQDEIVP